MNTSARTHAAPVHTGGLGGPAASGSSLAENRPQVAWERHAIQTEFILREETRGSPRNSSEFVMLSVAAIVDGRAAVLYARDGRRLCTVSLSRIGPLHSDTERRLRWNRAANILTARVNSRVKSRSLDPWQRRAETLVKSFMLRGRDRPYRGGRRHFERYPTHTWHDAALRLVRQGFERHRVRTRSGWERWAYTASNNAEKRTEAYEYSKTNHRQAGA